MYWKDIKQYLHFEQQVKIFMERWITGNNIRWSRQYKAKKGDSDVVFWPMQGQPGLKHFLEHFEFDPNKIKPLSEGNYYRGPLGFVGTFENDEAMWWCCDADNSKAVDAVEFKLIPQLQKEGLHYLYEYSGISGEKCHLWSLFDHVKVPTLRKYIEQIFTDAGLDVRDRDLDFELFPSHLPNNMIRVPGLHLRTMKVNPIRRMDGTEGNNPDFIVESFNALARLNEEEVKARLRPDPKPTDRKRTRIKNRRELVYNSCKLPVPEDLPPAMKKILTNCPALNRLLHEAMYEGLIEKRGGMSHQAGLYLYNVALYNDVVRGRSLDRKLEGKIWADNFCKTYRFRPHKGHNWDYAAEHVSEELRNRLIPRCDTLDRDFGYCDGCKFKGRAGFDNPRQLYWGTEIHPKLISGNEIRLVSQNDIRTETFVKFKRRVRELVDAQIRKTMLLASPQASGKSYCTDELAVELASRGLRVLIAVPTGDLAVERSQRIAARGSHAFLLMSHGNHFLKYNPGFDCPEMAPISQYRELGVGAKAIKEAYCDNCLLESQCRFPNQYADVMEEEHRIVIIQHAHFSSHEAMQTLLRKRFDVLIIDEEFISSCLTKVKVTEKELVVLEGFSFPWIDPLVEWLRNGGHPVGKLHPSVNDLAEVKEACDNHMTQWRVPEFVRLFNQEYFMDTTIGLYVFYPPPHEQIPLTILTNATPPLDMLKIVLDDPNIEVWGENEILDYRQVNVRNRVYQVLDGSASKTSLRGKNLATDGKEDWSYDRFIELLEFIGDKARKEYKEKRILITTYKDCKALAVQWLTDNYPDIMDRVLVSHMKIGTNEFQAYEVQFLLAGVYLNAKQFHDSIFELKTIANYWNKVKGRKLIPNYFWWGIGNNANIERRQVAVRRIQDIDGRVGVYEYDQFYRLVPAEYYYNLVEELAIAKTQQAIRLRFNNNLEKIIYIFSNFELPSFLITDSFLEEELLGYLRD